MIDSLLFEKKLCCSNANFVLRNVMEYYNDYRSLHLSSIWLYESFSALCTTFLELHINETACTSSFAKYHRLLVQ